MQNNGLFQPIAHSWLNICDARLRIITALLFAVLTVNLTHWPVALLALLCAISLAFSSGLSIRYLLQRLLALEGLMILLLLSLPFTVSGTPSVTIMGFTASYAGVELAVLILLKANAVVIMTLALIGSLEPMVFGHALARMGVPAKLVHLLLLTLRQIHILQTELQRLRQAMRARAFVPRANWHTWQSYGYLMGMLLVRSVARSQRIMAAMRCRGFHGRLYLLDNSHWQTADSLVMLVVIGLLSSLWALDSWL